MRSWIDELQILGVRPLPLSCHDGQTAAMQDHLWDCKMDNLEYVFAEIRGWYLYNPDCFGLYMTSVTCNICDTD